MFTLSKQSMQKQNLCTTEIWWSQKYHSKCSSILFTTLCLKKQRSSNILSMRQLRCNVTNRPAAEKARSASTLNAGINLRKFVFYIWRQFASCVSCNIVFVLNKMLPTRRELFNFKPLCCITDHTWLECIEQKVCHYKKICEQHILICGGWKFTVLVRQDMIKCA